MREAAAPVPRQKLSSTRQIPLTPAKKTDRLEAGLRLVDDGELPKTETTVAEYAGTWVVDARAAPWSGISLRPGRCGTTFTW